MTLVSDERMQEIEPILRERFAKIQAEAMEKERLRQARVGKADPGRMWLVHDLYSYERLADAFRRGVALANAQAA